MNESTALFIRSHADDDVRQLALRGAGDIAVDLPFALDQIAGRQTARRKLPTWAATEGIVYPPRLSMEQCSSEATARYKQYLAQQIVHCTSSNDTFVDLTGGFGVDFSFLARGFARAVYVERQQHLCDIAAANFQLLDLPQAEVVCCEAEDYLRDMAPARLIYADPARRDHHGMRTYALSDCQPDVVALRPLLLAKGVRVMLKLSPMLDWRKAVADIGAAHVREVHVVSIDNECKELLLIMGDGEGFRLVCVNDDSVFECGKDSPLPLTGMPREGQFLYEPNASIMKTGCFGSLSQQFDVRQIASDSHLFVADERVNGFPGREFVIDAISTMSKRSLRTTLGGLGRANIAVRNFPLSVADLRRRLKLSEGGSTYLFATTLADKSHVLLITRKPCTEP